MAFTFCCNTCGSTEEIAWDDVIGIDPTDYEQDCECCGISVCASCAREDLDVFPLCEPCATSYEEEEEEGRREREQEK